MPFKIEENFEIRAPIGQVWDYLIDPRRVIVCLPGAELAEVIDEHTYSGRVRVKVGPVTASYKGIARLEEAAEGEHVMRLTGEGKETAGTGSAKMAMKGRLSDAGGGITQVMVEAEIDVAGKMAQFGRGLMEDVSRQLFRQFAENLQKAFALPPSSTNGVAHEADRAITNKTEDSTPPTLSITVDSTPDQSRPVGMLTLVFRALWSRLVDWMTG